MSNVDALSRKVDDLGDKAAKFEGYADACRAAAGKLRGPLGALSGVSIDVGGMSSKSPKVRRAQAKATATGAVVRSARSKVSTAVDDLDQLALKYDRLADAARDDLSAAIRGLAVARKLEAMK